MREDRTLMVLTEPDRAMDSSGVRSSRVLALREVLPLLRQQQEAPLPVASKEPPRRRT